MTQEKNTPKPLLIVTDGISGPSGLARIGRYIATKTHENLSDVYRLGVAGYGGVGSRKFPFPQYHLEGVQSDWVLPSLPEIVQDFAGDERCIVSVLVICIGGDGFPSLSGSVQRHWFNIPDSNNGL